MGFRTTDFSALAKFNSAVSSELLTKYEDFLQQQVLEKLKKESSRTFAPSSFRCPRKSWFRLRGVEKDTLAHVDLTLEYTAEVGTARHVTIQSNLQAMLKDDWIDVQTYLLEHPIAYKYTCEQSGYETKITILNPPVSFACDGIIRLNGEYYLLEIKTCEKSAFDRLSGPKDVHLDQIKCYSTLLGISKVIFIYEERQFGEHKVFEASVADFEKTAILDSMQEIMLAVETHLAPAKVSGAWSDYMCKNCEYSKKCREWG